MKQINQITILLFFSFALLVGDDSTKFDFKYSTVVKIPDLSFTKKVYPGLDILEQLDFKPIQNKTVGILTNRTAVNRSGNHLIDILKTVPNIKVHILFEPEYGLFGIDDKRTKLIGREQVDPVHGARIINIFDGMVYPPKWAMKELDLILIDIQDTGVRYTTYIASMTRLFEAASDWDIPVMILDRPNPIRGDIISGPIPRARFQTMEAYHLFPIRHGLTIGEAAIIINEMGWVKDLKRVKLTVIPIANWERDNWYNQTDLNWQPPMPFIKDNKTLLAYAGMDLFRATNLNIGFGTKSPYLYIGAPWLVTNFFLEKLNSLGLEGVIFEEVQYRPKGYHYFYRSPNYDGMSCSGIKILITNLDDFNPIMTAVSILSLINSLHPREFQWVNDNYIDKLIGTDILRIAIAQKKSSDMIIPEWSQEIYIFNEFRKPFLLYH